jgi:hypothetical protein
MKMQGESRVDATQRGEETFMKMLRWSLGILLLMPAGYAAAQGQQTAAAASAASATAQAGASDATTGAKKKPRVWDNDNIPKSGDEISVVGQPIAVQDAAGSSAGATGGAAGDAKSDKDGKAKSDDATVQSAPRTDQDSRITAAKEKLASLRKDLDLQSRQLVLDSQTYYSKPDYSTDPEGAQRIKQEKDGIQAKQDEVDAAQKELDDLEARFGGAAGDSK